ncbi:hypothetical protein SLE2022_188130 [Rubroshorea leprosula]
MPPVEDEEVSKIEQGIVTKPTTNGDNSPSSSTTLTATTTQKLIAEFIGTFFLIFAGCGSVAVNNVYGSITFPGVCVTWGLIVMVMIYSVGHVSGAHFNPAVTIASALLGRFSIWQVPLYVVAQMGGSLLASFALSVLLHDPVSATKATTAFFGTAPVGSNIQSFIIEIIISYLLMFVVSAFSTDYRAVGQLGGIAVGMTILLNVLIAGPISGASMNPARTIGPAVIQQHYEGIWVYIAGPIIGTILGGGSYNLLRSKETSSLKIY